MRQQKTRTEMAWYLWKDQLENNITRPFGSIYPIMRVSMWQLHQPPKPESVPTAEELNSDSD